jgi:hypothetical protein
MTTEADFQTRLDGVRDNLKRDFSKDRNILFEKIKSNIANLQSRRLQAVRALSRDLYYQNLYCRNNSNSVLSDGCDLWSDLDKSSEYEAILSSVLELPIAKNNNNKHINIIINIIIIIIIINIMCIGSIVI